MRVLVVSGTWSPERNGVARVAVDSARALAERGHEVIALVPERDGEPRHAEIDGVEVVRRLPRGRLPLVLSEPLRGGSAARALAGRADVVLAHGSLLGAGLGRGRAQPPVVLVYHASLAREFRFARSRLPPGFERAAGYGLAPVAATLDRVALRGARLIVVLSEFTRSLLVHDHGTRGILEKVRLAAGGVDVDAFGPADGPAAARRRLGLDAEATLLLAVRRAEPRMGLEQLLEAVARLRAGTSRLQLALVGATGVLETRLRALSRELGVDGCVRFVGRVEDAELHDWYRAATLLVLPTVAYEGFGMVTAEALASGTPVVGTRVGATPELLEPLEPRLLAPAADAPALAESIRGALEIADGGFRARCREYAYTQLSWRERIGAWESALREAVAS